MTSAAPATPYIFRRAAPADAPRIIAGIDAVCAEGRYFHTPRYIPTPQWEAALRRPETVPDHLLLIAEQAGQLIGSLSLFPREPGSREQAELGMFVLPPFRNRGIGSAMMEYALDWASQQGYAAIMLTVHPTNRRAIHLYEKFGFRLRGEYRQPEEGGWRDRGWWWMDYAAGGIQ